MCFLFPTSLRVDAMALFFTFFDWLRPPRAFVLKVGRASSSLKTNIGIYFQTRDFLCCNSPFHMFNDSKRERSLLIVLPSILPADCSGPIYRSRGLTRRPADIPPIDPTVLLDLQRHTQEVAHSVEMMMRSLNGTIQNVSG